MPPGKRNWSFLKTFFRGLGSESRKQAELQTTDRTAAEPTCPPPNKTVFFPNANRFHLKNFNNHTHNYAESGDASRSPRALYQSQIESWKLLLQNAAPNALHDSSARFDPPKCDEDTRVEVIGEIMGWIQDVDTPQRCLCLTGAAGAGKSALQQTIAERCAEKKMLASSFFFSTADSTRNIIAPIIPTIAYQLSRISPLLRYCIVAAIEDDPLVFSKSLLAQIETLIARPLLRYRVQSGTDLNEIPRAILIDGLDECTDEAQQAELLTAIKDGFLKWNLPFRLFIASRPEWAIRTALASGGCLHELTYHIQLNDKYNATADFRRFLFRKLRDIGARSSDPRAQAPMWPAKEDVETLVRAASGQFIYAATVIRFISERRSSPVGRLEAILTWTSGARLRSNPFAPLDSLYAGILHKAKEAYEAVDTNNREFLILLSAYRLNMVLSDDYIVQDLDVILCSEPSLHASLLSDLHSLIALKPYCNPRARSSQNLSQITLYRKSLQDFLSDMGRCGDLFISRLEVVKFVARRFLEHINVSPLEDVRWVDHVSMSWDVDQVKSRRLQYALHILPVLLLEWLDAPSDFPVEEILDFFSDRHRGLEKVNKWLTVVTSAKAIRGDSQWAAFTARFLQLSNLKNFKAHTSLPVIKKYRKKWRDRKYNYTVPSDNGQCIDDIDIPPPIWFPELNDLWQKSATRARERAIPGSQLSERQERRFLVKEFDVNPP